jgi:hypothetical protein
MPPPKSPPIPHAFHGRLAPIAQLASRVRQRLGSDGVRYAARRNTRARSRHNPAHWLSAWDRGDGASWPAQSVAGIVDFADVKLAIDRCEITAAGHLWLDGWALKRPGAGLKLEASHCTIDWQGTFATARPDVVQALELSLVGREAEAGINVGIQVLAHVKDYVPGRSRLALTDRDDNAQPSFVMPVVPQIERSGSMWHSVYDAMRHRALRDMAYLEASVRLLKDLRQADWRERSAAVCGALDDAVPEGAGLKILVLARLHPNVAYLNLHLLAAACRQPADFVVCSMGQAAVQRANEYRHQVATIGAHTVGFVNAEIGTPSCELIEQFARSCQRRGCPGLLVYDDVAVAGAMGSLAAALGRDTVRPTAWPRRFPHAGPTRPAFTEPLDPGDGAGPYWRSAQAMVHGGLGAVLFDGGHIEIPAIPPFEGRGAGLEYLLKSALPEAELAGEAMLDLLDPAGQREAQRLDMLMLLAS